MWRSCSRHGCADGSVPTLARGTTDGRGAFRLEVARQRLKGIGFIRLIWAYSPGHGVAIEQIDLTENGGLPPIQLTLAKPFPRTLSILGPDDRPLAGVRLGPVLSAINGRALFFTPDDWLDRFTVATGADGLATLPYLPATVDPLLLRVAAPGIVSHNLSLPYRPGSDRITLKLGHRRDCPVRSPTIRASRRRTSRSRSGRRMPTSPTNPVGNRKATLQPILIRFDSGPVGTQADGSFLTPAQLLTGTSYRVVIRREGSPLAASDWLTATTDVTTIPPFRLRQVRKLVGQALDREGGPIVGARVFLPSGEPSDHHGFPGPIRAGRHPPGQDLPAGPGQGIPIAGLAGDPGETGRGAEIHTRSDERSARPHDGALSAPISAEESRALARRVLDPYLKTVSEKGDESTRMQCFRTLSAIDPTEVLELLEKGTIQNVGWADSLRITVAKDRFAGDPPGAESTVEAISGPVDRAIAYLRLASALPASDRDGKRRLFNRASPLLPHPEGGRGNAKGSVPIFAVGELAGGWLDLGEVEKARALISEGFRSVEAAAAAPTLPVRELPGDGGTDRSGQGADSGQGDHDPASPPVLSRRDRRIAGERTSGRRGACLPAPG